MSVKNSKVTLFAGNRAVLRFTLTQEDGTTALDLTSYTSKWALAKYSGGIPAKTPVLELKSATGGIVHTDPTNGVLEVTLPQGFTAALDHGVFYQELEVFDGSLNSTVVANGDVEILRNVQNT